MPVNIARIFSVILHPVFMPVYGLLIFFNSGTYISYLPLPVKKYIFLIVIVNTIVVPVSLLPLYLYNRMIRSIRMEASRERFIPLLINSVLYLFAYYLLVKIKVPVLIRAYMLSLVICILLVTLISIWYKLSLHMTGIGGLLGAVSGLVVRLGAGLSIPIMILILLSGLLATSRLRLNAHRPVEVCLGFLLGFAVMLGGLVFLWGSRLHG